MSLDPHFPRSADAKGYYTGLSFRVSKTYRNGVPNGWYLERWSGPEHGWVGVETLKTKKAARAYAGRVERGEV